MNLVEVKGSKFKKDLVVMDTAEADTVPDSSTDSDCQAGNAVFITDLMVMDTAEKDTVHDSGIDSDGQAGDDEYSSEIVDDSGSDSDSPAGVVGLKTDPMIDEFPGEVTDYDAHSDEDLDTGDEFKSDYCFMLDTYDSDIDEDVRKQFEIYRKELRKYEGFHVENVPKVPFFGEIRLIDINGPHARDIQRCTDFAIKKHNRKNATSLELVKIKKATAKNCSGYEYFITFDAIDSSGETKTYQTQVYFSIRAYHEKNGLSVIKFRPETLVD